MLFGQQLDHKESFDMMSLAADNGVHTWDTAEMYPVPQAAETQGASEALLGSWLKGQRREDHHVMTKAAGPADMPWIRGGPLRLDAANIANAIDASLTRLRTDYIDTLLLHWPDRYVPMFGDWEYEPASAYSAVPLEEQLEALAAAQRGGKIRRWGVSNETAWGVTTLAHLAAARGLPRPAVVQNAYSLLCRTVDVAVAECCHAERVGLLAYSPLAMGLLTGKYSVAGAHWDGPSDSRLMRYRDRYAEAESRYGPNGRVVGAIAAYARVAEEHGVSLMELSIRWVLQRDIVKGVVLGASSNEQLSQLLAAARMSGLPEACLAAVDSVHKQYPNPCP